MICLYTFLSATNYHHLNKTRLPLNKAHRKCWSGQAPSWQPEKGRILLTKNARIWRCTRHTEVRSLSAPSMARKQLARHIISGLSTYKKSSQYKTPENSMNLLIKLETRWTRKVRLWKKRKSYCVTKKRLKYGMYSERKPYRITWSLPKYGWRQPTKKRAIWTIWGVNYACRVCRNGISFGSNALKPFICTLPLGKEI